jgi:hypothetical protein
MSRLLVVSSDNAWNEYLQVGLGREGIEILEARSRDAAKSTMKEMKDKPGYFGGVLIDTAPNPGRSQDEAALDVVDLLSELREANKDTPILLWSRYPAERLSRIAKSFGPTAMLADDTFETIKAALAIAAGGLGKKPRFAKVELEIGDPTLRVRVTVDGKGVIAETNRPSTGLLFKRLENKFRKWSLWQRTNPQEPRYTDDWPSIFQEAGEDVAAELRYSADELRDAIEQCVRDVDDLKRVYFRFSLVTADADSPHPYVHVPFELLYDTAKKEFVRALAPVARRICLKTATMTATPLVSAQTFTGPVLFIKSDAHGSCVLPGTRFGGSPELVLSQLSSLDGEFAGAEAGRAGVDPPRARPDLLALSAGTDAAAALQHVLLPPSPGVAGLQIVHFSGHSVQADDGSVYLILPGREPGQLKPLAIGDFAGWARDAGVQLVLLSSCQSSTPDAVFRLAQAGIPAAIGFRWEVQDDEAAYFTGQLHAMLAGAEPLARAFHAALCAVRREYPKTPTFASPMLIGQNDEWTV